ncbi:hypothetical protein YEEN111655_07800 [Yersinia entomophaga]
MGKLPCGRCNDPEGTQYKKNINFMKNNNVKNQRKLERKKFTFNGDA